MNVEKLFTYCREAISAREYSKFFFTKTVSLILEWVNNFGADFGLTKEQLSHIPIETYISIQQETKKQTNADQLRDLAVLEALRHEKASKIILPQIIYDTAGVRVVPFQTGRPNFITNMKIEGRVVVLDGRTFDIDLNNKIVVIENADPGFDWIFSKQIIGLITKFGGANSHMAIRCAEFGLPAAIGCGEKLFEEISVSKSVSLDCSIGLIVPSQQDF